MEIKSRVIFHSALPGLIIAMLVNSLPFKGRVGVDGMGFLLEVL
jgi:hypothetical protein